MRDGQGQSENSVRAKTAQKLRVGGQGSPDHHPRPCHPVSTSPSPLHPAGSLTQLLSPQQPAESQLFIGEHVRDGTGQAGERMCQEEWIDLGVGRKRSTGQSLGRVCQGGRQTDAGYTVFWKGKLGWQLLSQAGGLCVAAALEKTSHICRNTRRGKKDTDEAEPHMPSRQGLCQEVSTAG